MESSPVLDVIEETNRSRALRRYAVLEAPSEDAFDRVTAMTARLFDASICLIALVDQNQVWAKSKPGMRVAETAARELSLWSRALDEEGIYWLKDAQLDPELARRPLAASDFGLRFYAAAPLHAPGGQALGSLCVMDHRPRDLSETDKANLRDLAGMVTDELELRRQAREQLANDAQLSDERYRDLFEMNPQPMWVFDLETLRYLAVNEAAIRHYGYSRQEFLSMSALDLRPPDEVPALLANLAQNKRQSVRESWRHRKKNGEIIEVEVSSRAIQMSGRPARLVTAYDTSERQRSRRALQLRDRYMAALVRIQRELLKRPHTTSGSLDGVLHLLGEVSNASRVRYLEHRQGSAGRQFVSVRSSWHGQGVPPDGDEEARWQALSQRLSPQSDEKLHQGEAVFVTVDLLPEDEKPLFADYDVRAALFVPLLAGGHFHGTLCFEHCASAEPWSQAEANHLQAAAASMALALERENSARALADEKERLAVTLASVTEGVITTDLHAQIVLMNRVAEELTGWTAAEAIGKPVREVFRAFENADDDGTQPLADSVAQALATGRTVERNHPVWLRSREGGARHVSKSSAPVYDERGQIIGAVKVFRDITAQEKIAGELLKASKLESIGTLAGGIAHDFNNILTAIIGNLSLGKLYSSASPRAVSKIEAAERACFRARDLTNQLLTFAKGGAPIKKLARLDETLREGVRFALHGSPVHCHFSIPVDLWLVEADTGQIGQVLNNLAINAVQAMPKGGFIEVRAENRVLAEDEESPEAASLPPGRYVRISVEDDGTGIPPEHMSKIFDPFFSTKENGSGLGLATSYSIIKKHGGLICVDSVHGSGSVFRVYLPAVERELSAQEPPPPAPPPPESGDKKRVLIMDDEPAVAELAEAMLAHLGYETQAVRNGDGAIAAYRRAMDEGKPFDAVILDLTIPGGMGGEEAIGLLCQIDPHAKAIVSSGYSNNPIMSHHRERGFGGVLTKPYHLEEMALALHKLLQGSATHDGAVPP